MHRRLVALRVPAIAVALLCAVPASAIAAENRGYEQVSPQDKNGSSVGDYSNAGTNSLQDPFLFGEDGNSALMELNGSTAGSVYGGYSALRAVRTPGGWASSVLAPIRTNPRPSAPFNELPQYLAAASDTSSVLFARQNLDTTTFAASARLDVVDPDGATSGVSMGSLAGPTLSAAPFAGASSDLTHIFFQSPDQLEPTAAGLDPGASMLYERVPGQGLTRAVGVLDNGNLASHGAVLGSGAYALANVPYPQALSRHAVSSDGGHVVFSANPTAACDDFTTPCDLYDRIEGQRTIRLSAPQRSAAGAGPVAGTFYEDASSDGSSVFFLSDAQLTDDDVDSTVDLYRYTFNGDSTGGTLSRISVGLGAGTSFDGQLGFVGASRDGQIVYFVSTAALAGGQGTPGAANLYASDHGQVAFVATLAASDHVVTRAALTVFGPPDNSITPQARLTPDGTKLAFQSHANLTSFDSRGSPEIYTYTLGSGGPRCISCGIVGGVATADASLTDSGNPNFSSVAVLPRNMSDDGNWIFFQSADPLVSGDVNGRQDVYQWHDGTVSLVSSGQGPDASSFVGSSPDNAERDAFFLTSDQLVPSDIDTAFDLYDARVGGGFAVAPPAPPGCSSDCQGPLSAVPFLSIPGSSTYQGPGNANGEAASPSPSFIVGKVSRTARSNLARTGKLVVAVRTSTAGTVGVTLSARIGRRWVKSSAVARTVKTGGSLRLSVTLSRAARSYLAKHKQLSVRVDVRYSRARAGKRASFTLQAPAPAPAARAKPTKAVNTSNGNRHA
jgi:hypothetical protein